MSFVAQVVSVAALFCLIEGLDGLVRRALPGRRGRVYHLAKIAYGLPLVLAVALALGEVSIAAGLLGCLLAAAALLHFFGAPARTGGTKGGTR